MSTTNVNCSKQPFPACEVDVLSYDSQANFPPSGELDKLYIDNSTGGQFSWNGTAYVPDAGGSTSSIITNPDGSQSHDNGDGVITPLLNSTISIVNKDCVTDTVNYVGVTGSDSFDIPADVTEIQWSVAAGGTTTKNAKLAPDYTAAGRDWYEYYNTKDIIPPCAAPSGYEWLADIQGSSYWTLNGFPTTSSSTYAYELAIQDLIVGGGTHFGTKSSNRRRQQVQIGDVMTYHTDENMNLVNTFKLVNGINTITRNTRFSITDSTPVADRPSAVFMQNRWKVKVYLSKISSL